MGVGEFVAGAFEVGTGFLDIRLQLLVDAVQILVVRKVLVLNLRVLLPGVGRGALHTDMEPVVFERAGEGTWQPALTDELSNGFLYLRTQGVDGGVVLIGCQDGCKHLVDDR